MSYNTQKPHLAAYVILRKGKKIAFVLRSNTDWMNNYYGLPSGKTENDESITSSAIREAKEEIGVDIVKSELVHVLTMHRHEEGDHAPDWIDVFFEVKSWEGTPFNAEPDVHSKLEWFEPNNLPENIITSVKVAIEAIERGESLIVYGW